MSFAEKSDFDKKHIISQIFRRCGISYATSEDISFLLESSSIFKMKRGSYVYMECDEVHGFYIILSGNVEVSKHTDTGTKKILSFLHDGNMFGMPEVFSPVHIVTAHCLSDSEIAMIPKDLFFDKVVKNQNLMLELLKMHACIITSIENSIVIESAESKVKNYLRWLVRESGIHDAGGIKIYRRHTHEEIGAMLGHSRETITKILNQMKERGDIDITRDNFIIRAKDIAEGFCSFDDSHFGFYGSEG